MPAHARPPVPPSSATSHYRIFNFDKFPFCSFDPYRVPASEEREKESGSLPAARFEAREREKARKVLLSIGAVPCEQSINDERTETNQSSSSPIVPTTRFHAWIVFSSRLASFLLHLSCRLPTSSYSLFFFCGVSYAFCGAACQIKCKSLLVTLLFLNLV